MTTIINKYKEKGGAYIGRGSIFGNPYVIGRDGTRDEVIDRYQEWFNFMIKDKRFLSAILELKDCKLSCFCAPQRCHGDVIAEYLNNL